MQRLQTLLHFQLTADGLLLTLDSGRLLINPLADKRVRVTANFDDSKPLAYFEPVAQPSFAAKTLAKWDDQLKKQGIESTELDLNIGEQKLIIHCDPFYLSVIDEDRVIYQDLPRRAYLKDSNGRHHHYHQRRDEDKFYGLGEKSGRLERSGRRFRMNNVDAVGYNPESGDPLYKHIPFLVRYRPSQQQCIALYYHSASHCEFDIGSERSGYWGEYSSFCVDHGPLDYVLMWGNTPQQVLDHYLDITGRPQLPTKASLGYLGSTMYYTEREQGSDAAVLGFIDECQHHRIPVSGFHLSSGYTKGKDGLRYTFNWNERTFPQPGEFVQAMLARGQVLSPNVKPGLLTSHPLYQEFAEVGAFIQQQQQANPKVEKFWGGDASFVDFTNPDARELWTQHLNSSLIAHGISSIWNDNNEFEMDGDALCAADGNPTPASQLRPVISNLMAETAYQAVIKHSDKRPFILSRAGFAGIQRYAQTWSGDNDSSWICFRFNIATMLGMSWSGVAFNGMDIGGFTGPAPTPELFLRWIQNGIFHPRFCIHSVNSDNTVTEPWIYPELLPQISQAFRLRYQLLPTLYSRAEQCHRLGVPMVSPLSYIDIQDSDTHQQDTSFVLADSLLCVAVTEPNVTTLTQYFPQGEWLDWYSGKSIEGGQYHHIDVQWGHSPLYLRQGSAVFIDQQHSDEPKPNLNIVLGAKTSGEAHFYDDDGETLQHQQGMFKRSSLEWQVTDSTISLTVRHDGEYLPSFEQVLLSFKVSGVSPLDIQCNNQSLTLALYYRNLKPNCWHYDAATSTVEVLLDKSFWQRNQCLELNFEQGMQISQENE